MIISLPLFKPALIAAVFFSQVWHMRDLVTEMKRSQVAY